MVFDYIMNKILIDIDNKTQGAISRQIAEFLIPKCALHVGTNEKTYSILQVNKHFSKLKKPRDKCKIKTFFGYRRCERHSPDYAELATIHTTIQKARQNNIAYVHFDSKEMANKAQEYIGVRGRRLICCNGKGFRL